MGTMKAIEEHRTTRGTLTLFIVEKGRRLCGRIEFAEDLPDSERLFFHPNYYVMEKVGDAQQKQQRDGGVNELEMDFCGLEMEVQQQVYGMSGYGYAHLRVLAERVPCPWMRTEDAEDEEIAQFKSVEEAEALVRKHKNPDHSTSCLCNHTSLTPEVAKHIFEYVVSKPCQVFFFDPGDIILQTTWADTHVDYACSYIVARKRDDNDNP